MTTLCESPPTGTATAPGLVERRPIRVMFCCNLGYYQPLADAPASSLENNRGHTLDITIVTSAGDAEAERWLLSSFLRAGARSAARGRGRR